MRMPIEKVKVGRVRRAAVKPSGIVNMSDPKFRHRFEKAKREWRERLRPLIEGARSSQQLTEHDFAIRMNARG